MQHFRFFSTLTCDMFNMYNTQKLLILNVEFHIIVSVHVSNNIMPAIN